MKSQFSPKWLSSVQPRKQRKYRHNAPLHARHKFLSSHLSKLLRQKYGKRSLPLRKGDEVLVMRGRFRKKRAKLLSVNIMANSVYLEGIQSSKKDGSKVQVPFSPRALMLVELNANDKERIAILNRKQLQKEQTSK